jgi:MSHA biogenesis protein MshP
MFPNLPSLKYQTGAGLPIALFIITVLALLVIGMSQLQQAGGDSVSLQIQSQRAFLAAESGAQVAVRKALESGDCAAVSGSVTFPTGGLSGCSASMSCSALGADIDGDAVDEIVFTIRSDGQCGSGRDGANRTVELRVR